MVEHTAAALLAASFFGLQCAPGPASAEDAMSHQLPSERRAAALPRHGGVLGPDVGPARSAATGSGASPARGRGPAAPASSGDDGHEPNGHDRGV